MRLRAALLPGPAPAAKTTVSAADRLGDVVVALEIAENRLDAGRMKVVFLVGISNQAEDGVAAFSQHFSQQQADLTVSSSGRNLHLCLLDLWI